MKFSGLQEVELLLFMVLNVFRVLRVRSVLKGLSVSVSLLVAPKEKNRFGFLIEGFGEKFSIKDIKERRLVIGTFSCGKLEKLDDGSYFFQPLHLMRYY